VFRHTKHITCQDLASLDSHSNIPELATPFVHCGREQSLGKCLNPLALTAKPPWEKLTGCAEAQEEHGFSSLKKTVISFQSFWKSIIWEKKKVKNWKA